MYSTCYFFKIFRFFLIIIIFLFTFTFSILITDLLVNYSLFIDLHQVDDRPVTQYEIIWRCYIDLD